MLLRRRPHENIDCQQTQVCFANAFGVQQAHNTYDRACNQCAAPHFQEHNPRPISRSHTHRPVLMSEYLFNSFLSSRTCCKIMMPLRRSWISMVQRLLCMPPLWPYHLETHRYCSPTHSEYSKSFVRIASSVPNIILTNISLTLRVDKLKCV